MLFDYDNSGIERELVASAHTLMVYEQNFKRGMIEDVFGRISVEGHDEDVTEDGYLRVLDFTIDHWGAYVKALWAMLKSGADLARAEGRPYTPVPNFEDWSIKVTNLNMSDVSRVVVQECQRGFFRTGAAASETNNSTEE